MFKSARAIAARAIRDSFAKLDPRVQVRNPVMFVVFVGAILTTLVYVAARFQPDLATSGFVGAVSIWLWLTVLFANFAEAVAEGRGKAQAEALRRARQEVPALRLREPRPDALFDEVASSDLSAGDLVLVNAGDVIPGDGEVIEGAASVDESAITGESAPVIRESGGDRSSVTGGTRVISDWIVVRIAGKRGESFLDRMICMVEGARRQKTPNEIALNILLAGLTIVFLVVTVTLYPYSVFSVTQIKSGHPADVVSLVALLVCLAPTTIGALLSAIGIAGMNRLARVNVMAMSGRAVEAAGDVDVLLLDKTGTITLGNRQASALVPLPASLRRAWPTPLSSARWPTRPPKAGASWSSPSATSASAAARSSISSTGSFRFRPRPG